jgi:hypothetical protein
MSLLTINIWVVTTSINSYVKNIEQIDTNCPKDLMNLETASSEPISLSPNVILAQRNTEIMPDLIVFDLRKDTSNNMLYLMN